MSKLYELYDFGNEQSCSSWIWSAERVEKMNNDLRKQKSTCRWVHPEALDGEFIEEMKTLVVLANARTK